MLRKATSFVKKSQACDLLAWQSLSDVSSCLEFAFWALRKYFFLCTLVDFLKFCLLLSLFPKDFFVEFFSETPECGKTVAILSFLILLLVFSLQIDPLIYKWNGQIPLWHFRFKIQGLLEKFTESYKASFLCSF